MVPGQFLVVRCHRLRDADEQVELVLFSFLEFIIFDIEFISAILDLIPISRNSVAGC
jgi:hypothetical protein